MKGVVMHAVLLWVIALFTGACNGDDKGPSRKNISKILSSPPFSSISDSIRRFPDDPELRFRRASLLSSKNVYEAATADYKKIWELTQSEQAAMDYASNLLLSGQQPEAIELLQQSAEQFPDNTEFNRRLGEIFVQNDNLTQALKEYDKIIARDSTNFEAWFDRGALLTRMKDTNGAIASLETSFLLLPINYSGMALANLYAARKDPRAIEVCDLLLSKDSGSVQTEPVFMKGIYYSEVKDYDKAMNAFDEVIRRDWKMTDAYIEKGIILYERKNFAEALKVFSMAATVSNTDADAYYWMGRCFESTGNKEQAILNYERAYSLDGSFNEAKAALRRLNG